MEDSRRLSSGRTPLKNLHRMLWYTPEIIKGHVISPRRLETVKRPRSDFDFDNKENIEMNEQGYKRTRADSENDENEPRTVVKTAQTIETFDDLPPQTQIKLLKMQVAELEDENQDYESLVFRLQDALAEARDHKNQLSEENTVLAADYEKSQMLVAEYEILQKVMRYACDLPVSSPAPSQRFPDIRETNDD